MADFFAGVAGQGLAQGIAGAISEIPATLVEFYKARRDGTFAEQQELMSRLRTQEDDRRREWLTRLEHHRDQARRAERRDDHLYRMEEMRAALGLALVRDHHRTALELMRQVELTRHEHDAVNGPFRRDGRHARQDVAHYIHEEGGVPALLIAPFVDETRTRSENDEQALLYRGEVERAWRSRANSGDLVEVSGVLERPLWRGRIDRLEIRRALADLPVIVVSGNIQAGRRISLELLAWNLFEAPPPPDGPAPLPRTLRVTLPNLPMPSPADEADLGFRDWIGEICAVFAGVLAEWHHVWRGRMPLSHERLPRELAPTVAAGSIMLVEQAVAAGRTSAVRGLIAKAGLYAAMGEQALAGAAARSALDGLGRDGGLDADQYRDALLDLKRALQRLGANAHGDAWRSLEELSEREILRRMGRGSR